MNEITKEELILLREMYPIGTKIVLLEDIKDPWNTELKKGMTGVVKLVDDIGTIHPVWENGSTLGVVFGVDKVNIVTEE